MNPTFRFNLGDQVRHRMTGVTGVVVIRSERIFGCPRYRVEVRGRIDGDWCGFDEDALELAR